MEFRKELKILSWIVAVFTFAFFLPIESARFNTAIATTPDLVKWYAQEHVILCLLPAFFIACGMGKGTALALLLAGPSLSLPNMLVIRGVIGTQKTVVYVSLVIVIATITGIIYGVL